MTDVTKDALTTAFDMGSSAVGKVIDLPGGIKGVDVAPGHRVQTFDPPWPELERIAGTPVFHDAGSFSSYVNTFKSSDTAIFAEPGFLASSTTNVTAVLDYHGHATAHLPNHCAHVATYHPRYADQWSVWSVARSFTQVDFAEFLEENARDIVEPAAAQMLDLVRTFKANRKQAFNSIVYQHDGSVSLGYEDRASDGSTAMPDKIIVGVPVFFMGAAYRLGVFVRYKVGNGGVMFSLKPDRPDIIEADAFEDIRTAVTKDTGIQTYLGSR